MAGIKNKYVNSRADFFRVLADAQAKTADFVKRHPKDKPFQSFEIQLDAMSRWTANGATPTKDDRKSITIGQILVRELEPAATDELYEYMQKLYELAVYFKDWMSDDELAAFDDSDPMSDFDD